jgi:hypothetical protein
VTAAKHLETGVKRTSEMAVILILFNTVGNVQNKWYVMLVKISLFLNAKKNNFTAVEQAFGSITPYWVMRV